jgi:Uncharacterized protein conserved in bacteria (DUF2188)
MAARFYAGCAFTIVARVLFRGAGAMGNNQHVVLYGERWAVTEEGASLPTGIFKTQSEAWEKAKTIARKERSAAVLHGKNGRIRARNTYWPDPRRTRG